MKINELLKIGIDKLKMNNVSDVIEKVRILLCYILQINEEYLATHIEDEVSAECVTKYEENLEKLQQGIPIQYITNQQCFYGMMFYVDENVLIPQPDTEILVEEGIKLLQGKKWKVLDICTGSGAIAISLAKNTISKIVASDISKEALQIAQKNAIENDAKVQFIQSNMFNNIAETFDMIISNPPYIESEVICTLSEEVKKEPKLALDGGKDGLDFYKILAEEGKKYLKNNGIMLVEIGFNQKQQVIDIFEKSGFVDIYSKKDYGGNDRIVCREVYKIICLFHQK